MRSVGIKYLRNIYGIVTQTPTLIIALTASVRPAGLGLSVGGGNVTARNSVALSRVSGLACKGICRVRGVK